MDVLMEEARADMFDARLSAATRSFLARDHRLLIGGRWLPAASGETFDTVNPSTGELLSRVAAADLEDVDLAATAARRALDGAWGRLSPSERGRMLWRLADLIEANVDELAEIEAIDNGKPVTMARAADVPLAADMFRYMAGWSTKIRGGTLSLSSAGDFHSYTLREPVGVVGAIVPWNFPLLIAVWKLAPALAVGCTVILKPAEQTPLSALRLGELCQEAGFPDGVVNILPGLGETAGAAIAAHAGIDKVAFTGSTEVGKIIVGAARGNLKRVSLELGGKSPVVVFPDADLERAIPGAAAGIFWNMRQTCSAGSRLFAHERVFDQLVDGVVSAAKAIKVGDSLSPDAEMGPLVSAEQLARVRGFVRSGAEDGAKVLAAPSAAPAGGGYYIEPTVITEVRPDMKVVREEIFGPVLVAQRFSDADLDGIAAQANDTIYGLAASIWTRDAGVAHRMARRIKAGAVWINCHNVFDPSLPFGGYKQSGWGREMGSEVLESYLETKAVTMAL